MTTYGDNPEERYSNSFVVYEDEDVDDDDGIIIQDVSTAATVKSNIERENPSPDYDSVAKNVERDTKDKPYNPRELRNLANIGVVQSFADTLADDLAAVDWHIKNNEGMNAGEEELNELEREIQTMPIGHYSWRDIISMAVKDLFELGDSAWILNMGAETGLPREIAPADSARLWIQADEHGRINGYTESRWQYNDGALTNTDDVETWESDEIVWMQWGSSSSRIYGKSPVEKMKSELEWLNQIILKQQVELERGSPEGMIVYRGDQRLTEGRKEEIRESFRRSQGKQHELKIVYEDLEFVPFKTGDDENIDWYERILEIIGAVSKVNPTVAGFFHDAGNRAKDESQIRAYDQRGFRTIMMVVEEAINQQLIWNHFGDEYVFEFDRDKIEIGTSDGVQYINDAADAAQKWYQLGFDVRWDGSELVVMSGEVGQDRVSESLKSIDADFERQVEMLSAEAYAKQVTGAGGDGPVWSDATDYVRNQAVEAVDAEVFKSVEVSKELDEKVKTVMKEELSDPDGWTLNGIVERVNDGLVGVDEERVREVCRTEVAAVLLSLSS